MLDMLSFVSGVTSGLLLALITYHFGVWCRYKVDKAKDNKDYRESK